MSFTVGDIVIVKGIVFKHNQLYDPHNTGRPVLVIHTEGQTFYYLLLSRSVGDPSDHISYHYLTNKVSSNVNHAFIHFKDIYKGENEDQKIIDKIPINYVSLILKKLVYFQENIKKDESYDEIKESIKDYINRSEVEYDETTYWDHRKKR